MNRNQFFAALIGMIAAPFVKLPKEEPMPTGMMGYKIHLSLSDFREFQEKVKIKESATL